MINKVLKVYPLDYEDGLKRGKSEGILSQKKNELEFLKKIVESGLIVQGVLERIKQLEEETK